MCPLAYPQKHLYHYTGPECLAVLKSTSGPCSMCLRLKSVRASTNDPGSRTHWEGPLPTTGPLAPWIGTLFSPALPLRNPSSVWLRMIYLNRRLDMLNPQAVQSLVRPQWQESQQVTIFWCQRRTMVISVPPPPNVQMLSSPYLSTAKDAYKPQPSVDVHDVCKCGARDWKAQLS